MLHDFAAHTRGGQEWISPTVLVPLAVVLIGGLITYWTTEGSRRRQERTALREADRGRRIDALSEVLQRSDVLIHEIRMYVNEHYGTFALTGLTSSAESARIELSRSVSNASILLGQAEHDELRKLKVALDRHLYETVMASAQIPDLGTAQALWQSSEAKLEERMGHLTDYARSLVER